MVETETAMAEVDTEGKKEEKKFLTQDKIIIIIVSLAALTIIGYISLTKWSVVEQPFLGGFLNTAFFGFPLYIFFFPVAVILYLLAYVWWYKLQWGMMTPFHGLWAAMNGNSEVTFKTDINLNFILKSEAGACLIFEKERYNNLVEKKNKIFDFISKKLRPVDQSVDMARFLQGDWQTKPMVNVGAVPASIVLDANGWTKDISMERNAIAEECDKWNDLNPDDQVHALEKAWRYMDEGKIPTPKNVKLYTTVPWVRVDNAYPKERNSAGWAGFVRQLSELFSRGAFDKGISMTTVGIVVFLSCLGISAMMFVMKLMTHTATVAH